VSREAAAEGGTMSKTRAWKDCPVCDGNGLGSFHLRGCPCAYSKPATCNCGWENLCPTCAAHFTAVDEALAQVAALQELAQQVCTYRGGHMPDVPEPLRLRIADLHEAAFHGRWQVTPAMGTKPETAREE